MYPTPGSISLAPYYSYEGVWEVKIEHITLHLATPREGVYRTTHINSFPAITGNKLIEFISHPKFQLNNNII